MYIKYVNIENFRGIRKASINFHKGTHLLIGPTNVGKSTILCAIDMVLNPNYSWWRNDILCELDFYHFKKDTPIKIEILLGCERLKCVDEKNGNCPYYEMISSGKSIICKFAGSESMVTWDNKSGKFLKLDDINDDDETNDNQDIENSIRIMLEAVFREPEGYVETKHLLLNEDGEERGVLTQAMKAWVGVRLLASDRNPASEIRIQYNSLLSKSINNIPEWKKICGEKFREALSPEVKKLKDNYAKSVFDELDRRIKNIDRIKDGKISIGIVGANDNDIIRQIELSREETIGEGEEKTEWELPFSRQGIGFQNITSLILGAHAAKENPNSPAGFSILMLEDPERNLDPQLQRSSIKNVKQICGEDSQIIISTHSPYVISPLLKLNGVKRLKKTNEDELKMISLTDINVGRKNFFNLRKQVPHELELFEALFSSFVVLWEGDCEAGFYQTLIRLKEDFPSEMLAGLNAGGDGCQSLAKWFKCAGYDVVVILDGDKKDTLSKLYSDKIPFIALPPKKRIEHIIVEQLKNIDENIAVKGIISSIGAAGEIFWRNEFNSQWSALKKIFQDNGAQQSIETQTALNKFERLIKQKVSPLMPENIEVLIYCFKKRYIYQEFANFFYENKTIPPLCEKILSTLKEFWFKTKELKQYQFNENEDLVEISIF